MTEQETIAALKSDLFLQKEAGRQQWELTQEAEKKIAALEARIADISRAPLSPYHATELIHRSEAAEKELAEVKQERDGYLTDCKTWAKEVDSLRATVKAQGEALERAREALLDAEALLDDVGFEKPILEVITIERAEGVWDSLRLAIKSLPAPSPEDHHGQI